MSNFKFAKGLTTLALVFSFIISTLPQAAYAQAARPAAGADTGSNASALAAIEEKTEARRKELGIPGMSLVIVKDDQIVYMKGLGYKDFEKQVPVTPDTQFAIGSSTKAFTALSVLMTQDEGKLSLDDSPKKRLPYFKMYDPETDKNITIRDLLSHSSGLNRTDLAMITGKLNRAELIQVAAQAKPTAKLREKFQYQNIMFAAAGEIVAQAQKKPWEKFVPERIFDPLGMTNTTMSMKQMEKAKDHSFGYNYNFDTKETQKLPFRDIDEIAPAGSINSSARDMAQWLRFILNGGSVNGKRLVSESGFEEWLKPQMKIGGKNSYGLGWFLQDWNGLKVVQHGGNIDGFNALVAMIPEKKLGFVMLTNVSASSLGGELMPVVWENMLGKPAAPTANAAAPVAAEKEAGKYRFEAAGINFDVQWKDGKLIALVPGQPTYTLENVSGRRYKLAGAPDGFFVTFKDTELFLEQPQGNYTLPRLKADTSSAANSAAVRELAGKYESDASGKMVEVKEVDGKMSFVIEGQQPYALGEKSKDTYTMAPLPDTYWVTVKRDAAGKVEKLVVTQPEGEFGFKSLAGTQSKITMTSDELMQKVLDALGGEANWRKISSRVSTFSIDMENQGVQARGTSYAKAPNRSATETTMTALGKTIATGLEYFDGTGGEEIYSFAPPEKYTGKRLDDARLGADFYGPLDWKSKYKKIEIVKLSKMGEEEAYAVAFEPVSGSKFTEYYSTKTFLPLAREGSISSSTSSVQIPYKVKYEDYREIDGIKLPFKNLSFNPGNGNMVTTITEVKHNVPVDDGVFKARKL